MMSKGEKKQQAKASSIKKPWGCFYLNRVYAASSQITAKKSFVSEKKHINKSQFAISDSFLEKAYLLKDEGLFYREPS